MTQALIMIAKWHKSCNGRIEHEMLNSNVQVSRKIPTLTKCQCHKDQMFYICMTCIYLRASRSLKKQSAITSVLLTVKIKHFAFYLKYLMQVTCYISYAALRFSSIFLSFYKIAVMIFHVKHLCIPISNNNVNISKRIHFR